ncbi:SRPBCC family protein [Rubrolithibacter danxiaensis]|uniref:SRPBCC family protein n=1 Tax=Rubrolithibacter danxiaensis TaxID=3390805 RepID=UPI003BF80597
MLDTTVNKITDTLNNSFLNSNQNINVNPTERILSIAAGSFIFYKGLSQIIKHPLIAVQEALVGGFLLYRGATGHCPAYSRLGKDTTDLEAIRITERFIVNSPKEQVFAFWRKLENLPRFMKHLASVEEIDAKTSHWKAKVPGQLIEVSWNAQITKEEENEYIGWQSVSGSKIDNAGKVEFKEALNGTGTELYVEISYFPPAGAIGHGLAKLFNGVFENMVREDVINFKRYAEGEEYQTYSSSGKYS